MRPYQPPRGAYSMHGMPHARQMAGLQTPAVMGSPAVLAPPLSKSLPSSPARQSPIGSSRLRSWVPSLAGGVAQVLITCFCLAHPW